MHKQSSRDTVTGKGFYHLEKLLAVMLVFLLIPAFLPSPTLAQEAKEDIELVLNEDGTLLFKGVIEAVMKDFNAKGSGDLKVKAQPTTLEGVEGFELIIAGKGEFTTQKPLNLTKVVLRVQGEGDMKNANAEIYISIENLVLGGNSINGEITIKASTSSSGDSPTSFRTVIEGSIDLSLPIDAETAAQINGMLGMVNAGIVNMQLSQLGMTFLKFEELDLTGIKVTEGRIQGTFRMSMVIDYEDYVTWYQATLYEQQVDPQKIEELGTQLREVINKLLEEKAYAKFLVELVLEDNRIAYNVDVKAQASKEFLNAYLRYIDLVGQATPAQPVGGPMAPVEVPLEPQKAPPLPFQANITLAEKPIDVLIDIQADGQQGTVKIIINELYLRKRDAGTGYEASLQALRELSTEGNETIDKLVIRLDKQVENLSLEPVPPLDKYVVSKEAYKLVLANVPPNVINLVNIKGLQTHKLTTTEQPTTTPTQTEAETKEETTTTPETTTAETPSPTQTRQSPTPTETTTSPQQTTTQQTTTQQQTEQEQQAPSLLGGSNMVLVAVGLIVLLAAVALLKR